MAECYFHCFIISKYFAYINVEWKLLINGKVLRERERERETERAKVEKSIPESFKYVCVCVCMCRCTENTIVLSCLYRRQK